jgi:DNA helicase HerA-like ATPase
MHGLPLLKRGAQRAMQPVLQIELAAPRHDVGEEVTIEGGIFFQECFQVQRPLCGNELVQAHLVRGDGRPLLLDVTMIWVRAYVSDALENHCDTLIKFGRATPRSVVTIWHMNEPVAEQLSDDVQRIVQGYTFDEPAIELGVLMENDTPVPGAVVRIPLSMLNRHGLVAGATGTGKTKTLQLMAEQISAAGVPVFAADIKGDLSGIASPGQPNDKLLARIQKIGQNWQPRACPTEFFALGGQGNGVPLRATMSSFGPVLLSKVLGLNEVQESSLGLVFHYADQAGLPLLDLKDLRAVLTHLTSDEGKAELKSIGGLSAATVGVILRTLINFADQGAEAFFGEPEFDTADLLRVTGDGRGVASLLELPNLMDRPAVFSTFLMWLLADLFHELPEVGDIDKPKLVFFFDEAHLLFDDASKAFLDAIAQTVRLIRSKGVGIFFVTQTPKDVPDDVLAQLGSRVQHQLRAHTPNDAKALKQTVATFPKSHYDLSETLQQLGIGEAIVTVMDPDGAPTPVAWTRMRAPESLMAPTPDEVLRPGIAASALMARYGHPLDRDSAHEILARKLQAGAEEAERERLEKEAAAQAGAEEKERQRAQAQAERDARAAARSQSGTQQRREKSMVEQITDSSAFKQFARTAGTEIVRSIFGTARRRRR